jgi:hypothetical protein
MSKTHIWQTSLMLVASLLACKGTETIPTHPTPAAIIIDGDMSDWDAVPTSRMHEDHAALKLCSDREFLYIHFVTDDIGWVRTIRMTGIALFLNRDGSKEREFFIRYRGGPTVDELMARSNASQDSTRQQLHPAMQAQLLALDRGDRPELTCFVRDWIVEKEIPADGSQGPAAAYGPSAGRFAYEFRIPLAKSALLYYGLDAGPGAELGIGAEWGGMPMSDLMPGAGGDPRDIGDIGSTGGASGGTYGGMPAGGAPPMQRPDLPEKQEVWYRTQLADPASSS